VSAAPVIVGQLWGFLSPALYAHEKRLVLPLVVSSTLLFLTGMLFCYFIVFGRVFEFIAAFAPKSISVAPDIEAYFNFVLGMFLAFGLAFEVPVVVVVLVLTGVISVEQLRDFRACGLATPGLPRKMVEFINFEGQVKQEEVGKLKAGIAASADAALVVALDAFGPLPYLADDVCARYAERFGGCLLYTFDAADDLLWVDLGGRRIIKKKN